ncbi:hypothetical protein ACFYZ9_14995 [Streptomyces sp. NPDC001691]|uniref:hypothetical protein n=1 Tax=unclassified Streptomyces TaxID=2593676 RepID=UPI000DEA966F|nr:hypothetical protein [Streptomyces sp. SDr-06]RCH68163.1 hypothetical protein DT019_14385 [Streptomyces sp. SDr-06]
MSFGHGGPGWGPGDQQTPDWAALADQSAARSRRRKWLFLGGGAVATAAVVAVVATVIVNAGSSDDGKSADQLPSPQALPSSSARPQPSFSQVAPPPPPNPYDYVSSAKKDTAPLGADTLFPGKSLTLGSGVYAKGPTDQVTDCSSVTQGSLGSALSGNGCRQVIRATFTKDGIAVTVGVAVFDTDTAAKKAKDQASGGIASLSGAGVDTFCRGGSVCRSTTNSYGRYAYFTTGGFANGKNVTKGDGAVFSAGDDLAKFTFDQIVARGRNQASAAAARPAG